MNRKRQVRQDGTQFCFFRLTYTPWKSSQEPRSYAACSFSFSSNNTAAMDSEKQQRSPGPSSVLDLKETQYLQHIENESNEGKDEFSLIFDDENKRVQQLVEKENQRIMKEMRENGTIGMCTICLEEIPPIKAQKDCKPVFDIVMMCCGVKHCSNCIEKSIDFLLQKSRNDMTKAKCFICKEPMRDATSMVKTIKPNDQRQWVLNDVASYYMNGTHGVKKDIKKAKSYIRGQLIWAAQQPKMHWHPPTLRVMEIQARPYALTRRDIMLRRELIKVP